MGSTSTSAGQALAMTGAILGHRNPRSTAIYAHVQLAPAKRAAERASSKIAVALGRQTPRPRRSPTKSVTRSEEHTSELQSLMRNSYAVFCLKKKINTKQTTIRTLKHYQNY